MSIPSSPGPHTQRRNWLGPLGLTSVFLSPLFCSFFLYLPPYRDGPPNSLQVVQYLQPLRGDVGSSPHLCRLSWNKSCLFSFASAGRTVVRISRSFKRWLVQKNFVSSTSQLFSRLLRKKRNPATQGQETQKAALVQSGQVFLIFIYSQDHLSILRCDHNHWYNYSYLTYRQFRIEGCIGAY